MNNLPTEILHNIFIHLPIVQKPECMFVCRQWADIILNCSLFNTIHINSKKSLEKFLDLIERKPSIRGQIENLTLFKCIDNTFNKKELLLRFPNLKKIKLIKRPEEKLRFINLDVINQEEDLYLTSTFNNYRIQNIEDFSQFELLRLLVTRDFCSHLVTLSLRGSTIYTSSSYIFHSLKDMPALKHLAIFGFDITMDALDIIHSNLPSLKSIQLDQVDLLPCVPPKNITATISITELKMVPDFKRTQAIHPEWLKYIRKKYTNLRQLKYRLCTFYQYLELADAYQFQMPLLLQNCGSQLTSLSLNCTLDLELKVIKALDTNGCRISELEIDIAKSIDIFDALTRTKQSQYVKTLTLIHVMPKSNLKSLKRMIYLTALALNYTKPEDFFYNGVDYGEAGYQKEIKGGKINIIELLNVFPESLESVDIRYAHIQLSSTKEPKLNQIKSLHLDHIKLGKEKRLDDFISTFLPHLKSLTLISIINLDKAFMIPGHHLSNFELVPINSFYKHVCLITKDCRNPRCYTQTKRISKVYSDLSNSLLPLSLEDLVDEEFLTIVCGSIKRFTYNGKEAYLFSDRYKFKSLMTTSGISDPLDS